MRIPEKLADSNHPLVMETARNLTRSLDAPREKLRAIFYYVRDGILFGFPENGDIVSASEIIELGYGQCNNKAALFMALARAIEFETRVHFSTISKTIQKGIFPEWAYKILPDELSHPWVEVKVEGRWRRIDSFINDKDFYDAGKKALRENDWKTGFSISCENGEADAEFNVDEERFVQMGAVTGDHGVYDDPADYYRGPKYLNRPGFFKLLVYRLVRKTVNRKVRDMREECTGGLCCCQ